MDERQERLGRNEALHRSINERLEELNEPFAAITATFAVVCECGDASCVEQLTVGVNDYERIRSDPDAFIVHPGHDAPDVEEVVEARDEYVVVRKRPREPAALAREPDERSR